MKVTYMHVQNIFSMISSLEKNQMTSRMTEDETQDVFLFLLPYPRMSPPDTLTAKDPDLTAEIYFTSSWLPRTLRIKRGLYRTCCMMCGRAEARRVSCQLPLKN